MKKAFLFCLAIGWMGALYAQKTPAKTAVKPVDASTKKLVDSASCAVGLSVANFYKQQGVSKLNGAVVAATINDILSGKKPALNDSLANAVMNRYITMLQQQSAKASIDSGKAFLAKNAKKPGVKTLPSGLQYEVLKEGDGPHPLETDSVICNYKGSLINGSVFESSYDKGTPAKFVLSRVISGWKEGIPLMSLNSKYRFYIPYNLAYGVFDYGPIRGGSTLIFEVELLGISHAPAITMPNQ